MHLQGCARGKENVAGRDIYSLAVSPRVSVIKMPRARWKGAREKNRDVSQLGL